MKARILAILSIAVLLGCAHKDPIDFIVQQASSNPEFRSGPFKPINLPATAPVEDVVKQAFENTLPLPSHVGRIKIVNTREVNISGNLYSAILVDTGRGRKIVLLRYEPPVQRWWNKVYDQ
jgi:hypothetical protein